MDHKNEPERNNGHGPVDIEESMSPVWLPGFSKSGVSEGNFPWLEKGRTSMPVSTAGSAKSSRSRRSQKVSWRVKLVQGTLLALLISAGCFLVFYPLIMHYIVEGAHSNETQSFFPYAKENCTRKDSGSSSGPSGGNSERPGVPYNSILPAIT